MQDKTGGKKYLEFHQKLLSGRGQIDKARALAVAKEIGLDVARIEKDIAGEEVKATLEESFKLAEALGLNGTPSYVVGTDVVSARSASTRSRKRSTTRAAARRPAEAPPESLLSPMKRRLAGRNSGPAISLQDLGFPFPHRGPYKAGRPLLVTGHGGGPFHGENRLRPQRPQPQSPRHP